MWSLSRLVIGYCCLSLLGAGCVWSPRVAIDRVVPEPSARDPFAPLLAVEAREQLRWTRMAEPRIGENTLSFSLLQRNGEPVLTDDLELLQEKKMHALLIREDLSDFQHLFPESAREDWIMRPRFREGGSYHLYLEYQPLIGERVLLHTMLLVPGIGMTKILPMGSTSSKVFVHGITAELRSSSVPIVAGTTTQMTIQLTERGRSVQELGPYLGSFGHITLIEQARSGQLIPTYALANRQPEDGRLIFETRIPTKGIYMAYAEFNIAGALTTFPFVLRVEGAAASSTVSN